MRCSPTVNLVRSNVTLWPPVIKRTGEDSPWSFWPLAFSGGWVIIFKLFFFCRLLRGWISKPKDGIWLLCLDESRCAWYREMLLLISCQRAEHLHMSSHHTSPFFSSAFHPTLPMQRQKSLVSMLPCILQAHCSLFLSWHYKFHHLWRSTIIT